jgi:hypothetical protein
MYKYFKNWYSAEVFSKEILKGGLFAFKNSNREYLTSPELMQELRFLPIPNPENFSLLISQNISHAIRVYTNLFGLLYQRKVLIKVDGGNGFQTKMAYDIEENDFYLVASRDAIWIIVDQKNTGSDEIREILLCHRIPFDEIEDITISHYVEGVERTLLEIEDGERKGDVIGDIKLEGGKVVSRTFTIEKFKREITNEEALERAGLGDEMPDRADNYVSGVKDNTITDMEAWDISQKIERYLEPSINRLSKIYEKKYLLDSLMSSWGMNYNEFSNVFNEKEIRNIIDNFEEEQENVELKIVDILDSQGIDTHEDLLTYLSIQERKMNEGLDSDIHIFEELYNSYDTLVDLVFYPFIAITSKVESFIASINDMPEYSIGFSECIEPDYSRIGITEDDLKQYLPLIYYGVEKYLLECKMMEKLRKVVRKYSKKEKGFWKYVTWDSNEKTFLFDLPEISLKDYREIAELVTPHNLDLSYATNPFQSDFYSEGLKERIEEAKKKISIQE